ncbi:YdcF family protein [Candidatus Electronema sp. JC]|uniref:YdcF family protein n=1 Tax=Candidatus Electronema sp. JC TaxID=3401570 RepID=UPI003B43C75F
MTEKTPAFAKTMAYLLAKLLPLLVYPLSLAILLCLSSALLLWRGRRRSAGLLLVMAAVLLWAASTRKAAELIMLPLEKPYPPQRAEAMPQAGAIVILGGVTRGAVPGLGLTDLDGGADRLVHGARLFRAGKAPLLILSGGSPPGTQPEAEAMAELLEFMGVPAENMLLEPASRNTLENGTNTLPLLQARGIRRILLVTSAYHMRRAQAVFARLGLEVIPAATDYQLVERTASILDWLPQADALEMSSRGLKEHLGWAVYAARANMP